MKFLANYLKTARQNDLYRQVTPLEPIDAVHARCGTRVYLNLASNNYLGLTHSPSVKQAAAQAAITHGTGSGGARLITGNHHYYTELEQSLAKFKGTQAAVVFSTGYMANVGVMSALAGPDDVIFSDELNHASIIDGCRLSKGRIVVYRHADTSHLAELLQTTPCPGKCLIVTDGVFSMDGDIAPLPGIVKLTEHWPALIIVDDAHATGVIGPGGRGTAAYYGLEGSVHIQIGTLSKALGAEGGFAAGSSLFMEYLINCARSFIFTTALSPATIAAAHAALKELIARPELIEILRANAQFVRRRLMDAGFDIALGDTPIIPVKVNSAKTALTLAKELKQEGLIVSAIRPPTVPAGASRLRLAISAAHTQQELAEAVTKITAAARRLDIIL